MDLELLPAQLVPDLAVVLVLQGYQAIGQGVARLWVLAMVVEPPPGVLQQERLLGHLMPVPAAMVAELLHGKPNQVPKLPMVVQVI